MRKFAFLLLIFALVAGVSSFAQSQWKSGTLCLAYREADGLFHAGTVVERVFSEKGTLYRFIFGDGGQALLEAAGLKPLLPALKIGAEIEAVGRDGRFSPGTVDKLIGAAAYVLFSDGSADWVSLANIAVRSDAKRAYPLD